MIAFTHTKRRLGCRSMRRVVLLFVILSLATFGCGRDSGLDGTGGDGTGGIAGNGGGSGNGGSGGAGGSNPFDTHVLDLRGFERFRIDQREALTPGGCPIPYLVDPAEIERVVQDQYLLTFSAAFTSQEEYQLCLEQAEDPDDCDLAPPVPREALTLNTSDLSELMSLFSSVSVSFAPNPCDGFSVDPCNIIHLEWDELQTSDRLCENDQPWIQTELAFDVLRAISELALAENQ